MIVLDGVGDRPVPPRGKTPLQQAVHPGMDRFAREGACGIVDMISPGVPPGSDTSHLAILGYDPYQVYTGRGPFEAIGLGMDVKPGDIAFRCNLATVDSSMIVRDRRAGRINSGTKELLESLSGVVIDGIEFFLKEGVEHRCALVMRGDGLSPDVSDVDPHVEGVKVHQARARSPAAEKTANALNRFTLMSHETLSRHKVNITRRENGLPEANIILARGAGVVPHLSSLKERTGINGLCIAGIPMVRGVCRLAGLDAPEIPGATGNKVTDIDAKVDAFLKNKGRYDFFLMNIKGTDIFGHDGDFEGKVRFIERVDRSLERLSDQSDLILAITGDHSTPVTVRDHTGDPLPLCIWGEGVRTDDVSRFDEYACARGSLGRIRGKDILPILIDLANISEKFGA